MRAELIDRIVRILTAPGPFPDSYVGEITISEDRVAYTSPILKRAGFSVWYRSESSNNGAPRWCSDLHLPGSNKDGDSQVYLYGPEALHETERLCRLAREVLSLLKEEGGLQTALEKP